MKWLISGIMAIVLFCGFMAMSAQAAVLLDDNFNSGLDSGKWTTETNQDASWVGATESGGNGYITAEPQGNYGNRFVDVVTVKNNFSDFDSAWSMRFNNGSWDQDHREVYFRCDNTFSPLINGYWIDILVDYPYTNTDGISFNKFGSGTSAGLGGYDLGQNYFQLGQWYDFELQATGDTFNLKWWLDGSAEPNDWLLTAQDNTGTPVIAQGRMGFGNYWSASTDVDNVLVKDVVPEPASMLLFGLGSIAMAAFKRKKG